MQERYPTLDALFERAGAPGTPPALSHAAKRKTWLLRAGDDPNTDSLKVLGLVLEEFMDLPPRESDQLVQWDAARKRVVDVLEEYGFRYYRGGRVLPTGVPDSAVPSPFLVSAAPQRANSLHELLVVIVRGLPRAMHPLTHRRRGAMPLTFESEYDIQDPLHALLRPWVADIRPEEFTPSDAGTSTRMDIEHYRRHPKCAVLWCVIYDPARLVPNPQGLVADLEGTRSMPDGKVDVRVFVLTM